MELLGYFLFGAAGLFCLWAAYFFTQNLSAGKAGLLLARGFITTIHHEHKNPDYYSFIVNFTAKGGRLICHQEKTDQNEGWYQGMPVLIRYRLIAKEAKVVQVLSYRKAYGKSVILSLLAILLIISGVLVL